jgi:hypothetical protein
MNQDFVRTMIAHYQELYYFQPGCYAAKRLQKQSLNYYWSLCLSTSYLN